MAATRKQHSSMTLDTPTVFTLLEQNRDLLNRCAVRRIGLFGSFARNEQKNNSDVDLLVEFDQATFDNFMTLAFSLEKLFHRKVDLIMPESLSPHVRPYVEQEVKWHEV